MADYLNVNGKTIEIKFLKFPIFSNIFHYFCGAPVAHFGLFRRATRVPQILSLSSKPFMSASKNTTARLRKRKRASGRTALFIDYYHNGKRSYEYLNLYLIPEVTREDKNKNKETLRLAEAVLAKRLVEIQNERFGFEDGFKLDVNFFAYYAKLCEQRHGEMSRGNWGNWLGAFEHLKLYCSEDTTFRDVTPEFVQGFKDFLNKATYLRDARKRAKTTRNSKPLSSATKASYFNKLRACLNQAFDEGIIPRNPMRGIEGFKIEDRERVYLTFDELKAMAKTECRYPVLRDAFLFSCLTGLRKSDIEKMTWGEVRQQGEFTRIVFRQKKTGSQEYLDINPQAVEYMGRRGDAEDKVFPRFSYSNFYLYELKSWAMRAGVNKNITFHSGRHTFAVLMFDLGADIYTVQKLLGHREIHTTQIYAKVMDKKKQEAAMLIPPIK